MCKRCGDLKLLACSSCKGSGTIKGGPFNFILLEDKSKVGSFLLVLNVELEDTFNAPSVLNLVRLDLLYIMYAYIRVVDASWKVSSLHIEDK
ncbi:hypothetical protein RND71_018419 [Anisodus tanguticus]|uniref:Uncharacterized protein n=1 Tax=Anisodus tanguticus TaxID=243964 RepID=A0AAE1S463_9SOLA|nr:hypothetical protein RND71_018419 [Anisodus tanguticus]